MPRNRFDAMLARAAAEAGAATFGGVRVVNCRRVESGAWSLTLRGRGTPGPVGATVVVDASGRSGHRLDGPIRFDLDDRLLAIVIRLGYDDPPPDLRTYIEAVPSGWWYSSPLPGGVPR